MSSRTAVGVAVATVALVATSGVVAAVALGAWVLAPLAFDHPWVSFVMLFLCFGSLTVAVRHSRPAPDDIAAQMAADGMVEAADRLRVRAGEYRGGT